MHFTLKYRRKSKSVFLAFSAICDVDTAYFSELISCPSACSDLRPFEDTPLEAFALAVRYTWNSLPPVLSMAGFFGHFGFPSVAISIESPSLSNQPNLANQLLFLCIYHSLKWFCSFICLYSFCTAFCLTKSPESLAFPTL